MTKQTCVIVRCLASPSAMARICPIGLERSCDICSTVASFFALKSVIGPLACITTSISFQGRLEAYSWDLFCDFGVRRPSLAGVHLGDLFHPALALTPTWCPWTIHLFYATVGIDPRALGAQLSMIRSASVPKGASSHCTLERWLLVHTWTNMVLRTLLCRLRWFREEMPRP